MMIVCSLSFPCVYGTGCFLFSMTIGVVWEFFEFGTDTFMGTDMQKDTIVQSITTVMLDPTNSNIPITIDGSIPLR